MAIKANRPVTVSGRVFLMGETIPGGMVEENKLREWIRNGDVTEDANKSSAKEDGKPVTETAKDINARKKNKGQGSGDEA